MFNKVLVANRGAVAARVLRALNEMNIRAVAVYSEADAGASYLELADETYLIGPAPASESYLNRERLLEIVQASGSDGVHPGYGFLAEDSNFARMVVEVGAHFIGPSPRWIDEMGHKARAREIAAEYGMPMAKGSSVLPSSGDAILNLAREIGYPLLVKPVGGGGGIGMLPVESERCLLEVVERARSTAMRSFANGDVYLERLFNRPRHIEFQVLGDDHGGMRHLFERDCSTQRRSQKLIEETPAPLLSRTILDPMAEKIGNIMQRMGYNNIGTVEMLVGEDGSFNFLEVNTRLQVEHGVTEEVLGIDLVKAQIRAAAGENLVSILPDDIKINGHAIQARVYAEDPVTFFPSPGVLRTFRPPPEKAARVETGYAEGRTVTQYYDPLLAKVIVHAETREQAISKLIAALDDFLIEGVKSNIPTLLMILNSEEFKSGHIHTSILSSVKARRKI